MNSIHKFFLVLTLCFLSGLGITVGEKSSLEHVKAMNSVAEKALQLALEKYCADDDATEKFLHIEKIPALSQVRADGLQPLNCSFYALYFGYVLIKYLDNSYSSLINQKEINKLFSSYRFFDTTFLNRFNLRTYFDKVKPGDMEVTDENVIKYAEIISPKIIVVKDIEAIREVLRIDTDYQVLVCKNKKDHWFALGVDHSKGKIYFVDSWHYLNVQKEKYSNSYKRIFFLIRARMLELKDSAGGAGGGGGAV